MNEPPEFNEVDLAAGDPGLRDAPLTVRKADAWLAEHNKKPGRRWVPVVIGLMPFTGILAGAGVATVSHSEPIGAVVMLATWVVAGVALWGMQRSWGSTAAWANTLVKRYKDLQDLGVTADLSAHDEERGESARAVDRLVDRIEALAGPERKGLVDAAKAARDRALRLDIELSHIDEIASGDPDVALDAARERILAELARTRARVAEAYGALVALHTGGTEDADDELESNLARLGAELEVHDASRQARAGAAKQTS